MNHPDPITHTIEGELECSPDIHEFVSCLRPRFDDEQEIESAEQDS